MCLSVLSVSRGSATGIENSMSRHYFQFCFSDSAVITEPQEDRKQVEEGGVCECKADGNPSPKYYWKSAAGVVLSTNNTLIVTKDGNYTCVAENGIGNDTHRIFIEIKSKSDLQIFIISKY